MFILAFLSLLGMQVFAQKTVSGTVTSAEDGSTIPGATVQVKGTTVATMTDLDGKYTIEVPEGATTLEVSAIGYQTAEVEITGSTVDVALQPGDVALDEVVVTALGISREKKALGYAVQDIGGDDLAKVKTENVVSSLTGKIAGVQITQASGAVGASARIVIRGNNSFNYNQPLFVVDGTPISNYSTSVSQWGGADFGNALMDIDPENIESISVLKGANATALYGSRGANGVILITTKKAAKKKGIGVKVSSGVTFDQVYILPYYQNKYGQGYLGSEYMWKKGYRDFWLAYGIDVGDVPSQISYEQFVYNQWPEGSWGEFLASLGYGAGFSYVDGNWGGTWDGMDESWGPRLDQGFNIPQFDSPIDSMHYNPDSTVAKVFYHPTPWVSHPDNVSSFFQTGITLDNSVEVSGGNQNANARFSVSQLKVKGTIPNTDLTRYSVNFAGNLKLSSRLTATANLTYVNNHSDNLPGGGYDVNNVMQSIGSWFGRQINMASLREHWNEFDPYGNPYNWNHSYHNNPYWTVYKNTTNRTRDRVFGNLTFKYDITDWLNIMLRLGNDYFTETRSHREAIKSMDYPRGHYWKNTRVNNEFNGDLFLNFNKSFGDFAIDGFFGANYMRHNYSYVGVEAPELVADNLYNMSNVSGTPSATDYQSHKETNSLFSSLNFSYKSWLFLNTTFRRDWSSTLPKEHWAYNYPSVGFSFIFTDALGIESNFLSFGKIRASWAQVGNDTDPYMLTGTYTSLTPYNGIPLFRYTTTLPPVGLMPEMTTSIEAGLEMRFLNNRFGFDLTLYDMKSRDQIMTIDIAPSSGFTQQTINAGEIENKGIELVANFNFVHTKAFDWRMDINWSKDKNMVNKLYGNLESYQLSRTWKGMTVEARPGQEFGVFNGIGYLRDKQGRIIINPNTGMPVATPDPIILGSVVPDWTGGIRNTFRLFNQVSLSVLVDARFGGKLFSVTDWFGAYAGILKYTAEGDIRANGLVVGRDVLSDQQCVYGDYETDENGNIHIIYLKPNGDGTVDTVSSPVANTDTVSAQNYFEGYWNYNEPSMIKADYVKLREVALTYSLPKTITNKLGFVQGVDFSLIGRNLALLYTDKSNRAHIDPETGFGTTLSGVGIEQYQIPATRSVGFKLTVKF